MTYAVAGTTPAFAAVAPDLGAAAAYAVFGKTGVTNNSAVGTTHIWGNVGADAINVTALDDATQVDGAVDAGVGVEAAILATYTDLNSQVVTGALDLTTAQIVTPGVYTIGATTMIGDITLNGAGVYIFRADDAYAVAPAAKILLTNGATACNVFWQIPGSMTIGAAAEMAGTIITNTGSISLASGATLQGRALSHAMQVTLDANQITEPVCAPPVEPPPVVLPPVIPTEGTINVVSVVINDNGGTKTFADFPLFVNGGLVVSGATNTFAAPTVNTVTVAADPGYTQALSGDCGSTGVLNLEPGETKFCVITNDDIGPPVVTPAVAPLIKVLKVPSPLALSGGPGSVMYTYTLRNIGTVPVTDISMIDDSCTPLTLISGDNNSDARLDTSETWIYHCSATLTATHTNTVVATGWANGISAVDIASITVVVGSTNVPPLIRVTKIPSPLRLSSGPGTVSYIVRVTNPGKAPLSNVTVDDDMCGPMRFVTGDFNNNSILDTTEAWRYTCQSSLTQTTTNTVSASGDANGLTARDLAIVTVIMLPGGGSPGLPNTGFAPKGY